MGGGDRIKQFNQPLAVDVEFEQYVEHIFEIDVPVDAPDDDVKVFFAGFKVVGDAVEQEGFGLKLALRKP